MEKKNHEISDAMKNGVKEIQAVAYNGVGYGICSKITFKSTWYQKKSSFYANKVQNLDLSGPKFFEMEFFFNF